MKMKISKRTQINISCPYAEGLQQFTSGEDNEKGDTFEEARGIE
jgi:hypothetical protein